MNDPLWREQLAGGLEELDLRMDDRQIASVIGFLSILSEWNRSHNLTTVPETEYVPRHILDSLLPALNGGIASSSRIVDIGSGAGLPGIPLKILSPEISLTLIEANQKRCLFLEHLVHRLEIQEVTVVNERAEKLAHMAEYRECFDITVSRALAPLDILAELSLPFVRPGGKLLAIKGEQIESEFGEAKDTIAMLGGSDGKLLSYIIPATATVSNLVSIEKTRPTPENLPRSWNQISKRPLASKAS